MVIRYWELRPLALDQKFIEKLENKFDLDSDDAEIEISEDEKNFDITNQIIYFLMDSAVNIAHENWFISYKWSELIRDSMNINYFDSYYNIEPKDLPKKDREYFINNISI